MKLLRISNLYLEYINKFYARTPELEYKSYEEQRAAFDYDGFGMADFWSNSLKPLGYEMTGIRANVAPLQRAWAREKGLLAAKKLNLKEIVLHQVSEFKPDILWYDHADEELLCLIRAKVPSINLVLGWVGSAMPRTNVWRHIDLVLSCAHESVEYLNKAGFRASRLDHAFEPRINDRLKDNGKSIDLSFTGQIIRDDDFHLERERILVELCSRVNLQIFSPSADITYEEDLRAILRQMVYYGVGAITAIGVSRKMIEKVPKIGTVAMRSRRPLRPVNPDLKPCLRSSVFGVEMFQALRDSKMSLNIHADSSPLYASNMRLFEATGVGTCLVTDWKKNISEYFEPDKEVVTYRSAEECVDKIQWLLEHPIELEAIARAGQARTLKDHTFAHRAKQLDEIIQRELKKKN